FVNRAAVIVDARAIGSAYFAQDGTRPEHDVGNTESVANLDQLAARDHHFMASGQFVQREIDGSGVIVDRYRRVPQQPFKQDACVYVPFSALARGEIVFEIGIAGN